VRPGGAPGSVLGCRYVRRKTQAPDRRGRSGTAKTIEVVLRRVRSAHGGVARGSADDGPPLRTVRRAAGSRVAAGRRRRHRRHADPARYPEPRAADQGHRRDGQRRS
jgi:hypothetical protein